MRWQGKKYGKSAKQNNIPFVFLKVDLFD